MWMHIDPKILADQAHPTWHQKTQVGLVPQHDNARPSKLIRNSLSYVWKSWGCPFGFENVFLWEFPQEHYPVAMIDDIHYSVSGFNVVVD